MQISEHSSFSLFKETGIPGRGPFSALNWPFQEFPPKTGSSDEEFTLDLAPDTGVPGHADQLRGERREVAGTAGE
jgi:hypothetical protein